MSDVLEETILENQNILPVQFFSGRSNRARMEPLRRLACAVLIDAVRVFQTAFGTPRPDRRRQFNEAQGWLFSLVDHGPFSFENVCYLLDVEPSRLRISLRLWQAMKREGQPCPAFRRRSRGQSGEFARRSVQERHTLLHSHRRERSTLEEEPCRLRSHELCSALERLARVRAGARSSHHVGTFFYHS
jgi:hypothetical protein